MSDALATAADESLAYIEAPDGQLLAILTRPVGPTVRGGVLLCPGGWFGTVTNRNRVYIRLARELAARGYGVLRFDWHGVGESEGIIERYDLDLPFTGDVAAAARFLEGYGYGSVSVLGVCFGARSALAAAPVIPSLRELLLISFPVPTTETASKLAYYDRKLSVTHMLRMGLRRDVVAGLLDTQMRRMYRKAIRTKWRALRARAGRAAQPRSVRTRLTPESLLRRLQHLDEAQVPVTFLFGDDDVELKAFAQFGMGSVHVQCTSPTTSARVNTVAGKIHGFESIEIQDLVIDHVVSQLTNRAAVSGSG